MRAKDKDAVEERQDRNNITFFKITSALAIFFNIVVALDIVSLFADGLGVAFSITTMVGGAGSLLFAALAERRLEHLTQKRDALSKELGLPKEKLKEHETEKSGMRKYVNQYSKGAVLCDVVAITMGVLALIGFHSLPIILTGAIAGIMSFIASSLTFGYGMPEEKEHLREIRELERIKAQRQSKEPSVDGINNDEVSMESSKQGEFSFALRENAKREEVRDITTLSIR